MWLAAQAAIHCARLCSQHIWLHRQCARACLFWPDDPRIDLGPIRTIASGLRQSIGHPLHPDGIEDGRDPFSDDQPTRAGDGNHDKDFPFFASTKVYNSSTSIVLAGVGSLTWRGNCRAAAATQLATL